MRIGLFLKREVIDDDFEAKTISLIKSKGHVYDNENPEFVFSVGGDGTFLKAVHKYLDKLDSITFVCFNKGNLGYFSDFVVEDMEHVLEEINGKEFESRKYRLLKAMIDKEVVYAVNEIRIENPFHTLISEVYVNGSYLETFRGNGLVVSTSIGSTAYNKSLGGAVVEPSLEVMQVNEIAPINNRLFSSLGSSLVLSDKNVVTFKGDYSKVLVGYDYLIKSELHTNEIKIELSDKRVSVLSKKSKTYINKLSDSFVMRK